MTHQSTICLKKCLVSFLSIILVLGVNFIIFVFVFDPYLLGWGANPDEQSAAMPGDQYAARISGTRSIDIDRPNDAVWEYCAGLGADKNGFYSYDFLERLYGCEFAEKPSIEKKELRVGQRISFDSSAGGDDGFEIIEVDPGRSMVLAGWGSFLVHENANGGSRLIVRTHDIIATNPFEWIYGKLFDAMHYIMERRMMLGIKDLAESNNEYTHTKDMIWLLCIFLSGIGGIVLICTMRGYLRLAIPILFYSIWQVVLIVFDPQALWGIVLIIILGLLFFAWYAHFRKLKQ